MRRRGLTLSAVADHRCSARLCAACITRRHDELRRSDAIAATIAERGLWRAVIEHGISYAHALRIRRGWRGAGRSAPALPYRSRGWVGSELGSRRPGRPGLEVIDGLAPETELELRAAWGDR